MINFALLGVDFLSMRFGEAINSHPLVHLTEIIDESISDEDFTYLNQDLQNKCKTIDDVIFSKDIQAVIIGYNVPDFYNTIMRLIKAGKNIFCTTFIDHDVRHLIKINELTKMHKVKFQFAYLHRFCDKVDEIKKKILSKRLSNINDLNVEFYLKESLSFDEYFNTLSNQIDALRFMTNGEITSILANYDDEDNLLINGFIDEELPIKLVAHRYLSPSMKLVIKTNDEDIKFSKKYDCDNDIIGLNIYDFINNINNDNKLPQAGIKDALLNEIIVIAVLQSLKNNKEVFIRHMIDEYNL